MVQFVKIRDKNVNFILCQFQNRNSKHSFCKYNTNLWNWHRTKFTFLSLILTNCTLFSFNSFSNSDLFLVLRISFLCYDPSSAFVHWWRTRVAFGYIIQLFMCHSMTYHKIGSGPPQLSLKSRVMHQGKWKWFWSVTKRNSYTSLSCYLTYFALVSRERDLCSPISLFPN